MSPKGQGRKRKALDEKILAKARQHIQEEDNADDDDDDDDAPMPHVTEDEITRILTPDVDADAPVAKKIRKPRHAEKSTVKPAGDTEEQDSKAPEKSKRKKKKKKKKSAAAAQPLVKTAESIGRHSSSALDYLQKWKHCRDAWRFEKLKQVWLLQNCLDAELLPEKMFPDLLEYMGSVRGQARAATEKEMGVTMKAYEITQNPSDGATLKYDRARQILQMLSSD